MLINYFRHIIIIYVLVISCYVTAQKLPFQKISVNEGLPQSTVNNVFEDRDGYIWVASWGSISRYDGKQFKKYGADIEAIRDILNSYAVDSNRISCIFQESNGNIWFCSKTKGILVFDNHSWRKITTENGLPECSIYDGICDGNNQIWLTTDNGLLQYEDNEWRHISGSENSGPLVVNSIISDHTGRLFLGSEHHGLIVYEQGAFTPLNKDIQQITGLAMDKNGILWVTTFENGVFRYSDSTWTHFNPDNTFYKGYTSHPCIDINNHLWVKTAAGLSTFNGTSWSFYGNSIDLTTTHIWAMMTDSNGLLWLCTHGDGLILLKNTFFEAYYYYHGLSNNTVNGLKKDSNGHIWIRTQLGVDVFDGHNWTSRNFYDETHQNTVNQIYCSSNGDVWFAHRKGVSKYTDGQWTDYTIIDDTDGIQVICILSAKNGTVYAGTYKSGLYTLNGQRWAPHPLNSLVKENIITSLFEDSKGRIWVNGNRDGLVCIHNDRFYFAGLKENDTVIHGLVRFEDSKGNLWGTFTGKGLFQYKDQSWHQASFNTQLNQSNITQFAEDEAQHLWLATLDSGFGVFDGHDFTMYTEQNGLSDNACYSILAYKNKIYIGTNNGLNIFDGQSFIHYNSDDGLSSSEFNSECVAVDDNGDIWFGTIDGVTRYTPEQAEYVKRPPVTHIQNILVNNTPVKEQNPEIAYNSNVSFDIIGLYYPFPDHVTYKYKMSGYDETWTLSERTVIEYRNLHSGNYTFQVNSRNQFGIWGETPVSFSFTVKTPFWETPVFKISIIIAIMMAGVLIYSFLSNLFHSFLQTYQKKWFGHFKLIKKLGQGGMGEVFLAKDRKHNRQVALKILYKNILNPDSIRQFEKEGLICESIHHDNVINIFDKGVYQTRYYLSMEYIDGISLQEIIHSKQLNPIQACIITDVLLDIVKNIHQNGVIHRDLKPDNILFKKPCNFHSESSSEALSRMVQNHMKILDFGLAKFIDSKTMTQIDINTGTPMFLPPEHYLGRKDITCDTDCYAAGVILYLMVSGEYPYQVDSDDIYQIMSTVIYADPTPVKTFAPDIPEPLAELVDQIIAKNPKCRLKDIDTIKKHLKPFLNP